MLDATRLRGYSTKPSRGEAPALVESTKVASLFQCNTYTHLFEGDLSEVMDRLEVHSATESPERVLGVVVPLPSRRQNPH